jgi:hypothetical protein
MIVDGVLHPPDRNTACSEIRPEDKGKEQRGDGRTKGTVEAVAVLASEQARDQQGWPPRLYSVLHSVCPEMGCTIPLQERPLCLAAH